MSLATRCPVCQTVFRVVQDQLKVSEGWVRCGRCAKVFNAFEGLFDLEREFPALRQPTPSQRVLEDLATRNRQPESASQWDDEFDSAGRVQPAAARPPPSSPTVPAARVAAPPSPVSPAARVAAPSPTTPTATAPVAPAPPAAASTSSGGTPKEATTPVVTRTLQAPVPANDDAAIAPRAGAVAVGTDPGTRPSSELPAA